MNFSSFIDSDVLLAIYLIIVLFNEYDCLKKYIRLSETESWIIHKMAMVPIIFPYKIVG